ncbi:MULTISPECIES: hypothetical protein [unclassified Gordonia (in: high G+C Gram-positive bacteria)]|jgi:hypothetical protein|uniref:hypothetical protein n=1 Tax=Gordonia sp. VNQ95 TaxID=3156619 RepID=UPI0032B570FE
MKWISAARSRGDGVISPTVALVSAGVALMILLVLTASVIREVRAYSEDAAVADNRTTLRAQAGDIVAAVFSVDAAHWQSDRARARSMIAGDFANSYAAQLQRPPASGVAAVRWRAEAVALVDVGTERGATLIRASVTTRPDQGVEITEHSSVRADFASRDGRWLLTSVEVVQ